MGNSGDSGDRHRILSYKNSVSVLRIAGAFRGLAGHLESSAQERLNPDFGRECPMYGTLVCDIKQARPLLF